MAIPCYPRKRRFGFRFRGECRDFTPPTWVGLADTVKRKSGLQTPAGTGAVKTVAGENQQVVGSSPSAGSIFRGVAGVARELERLKLERLKLERLSWRVETGNRNGAGY